MTKPMFDAVEYVDRMAGQALAGILAAGNTPPPEVTAKECYDHAFALLAEREKRQNPPAENP
jgi:mannose/cellobiose epimerase-like protein (N-acyl-D-glucosamine 2-epimerase family)